MKDKNAQNIATPKHANPPILTIAVSSRALFDFEEENAVFEVQGEKAYMDRQLQHLKGNKIPAPGIAFPMVKKLLSFNDTENEERLVDIIVLSRNDPITGLRVFRAIQENNLNIQRGCFTRGVPSLPYLTAFNADLFLSAHSHDVKQALKHNLPAARVLGQKKIDDHNDDVLRIAFDGDAVLFGDESERTYQECGLSAFHEMETELAKKPLSAGPLKPFFDALWKLRHKLPTGKIRTALITARGAPAHERPIRTLMKWKVDVDEAHFLSGTKKQNILDAFRPDFFFDDQLTHMKSAKAAGHVDHGIANEKRKQ